MEGALDVVGSPTLWDLALQARKLAFRSAADPARVSAAAASDYWRVQRRQLAALPDNAANELLRRLLQQRALAPPQLELFQHCATSVALSGRSVTGAHLTHLGSFTALHELALERCTALRDAHLRHLAPLAATLQRLSLAGCSGVGDSAAPSLQALTALQALDLSGTALGSAAVASIVSRLPALASLDAAELPVEDAYCAALGAACPRLHHLRLAGSAVTTAGMGDLEQLTALASLDVSYTQVGAPPLCASLQQLSMVHCTLDLRPGSPQEALWLEAGAALPRLRELQLAKVDSRPPGGDELLRRLVAGAAPSLSQLNLHGAAVPDLAMLAGATALTWLDLSATTLGDGQLADAAPLLPALRWLSLARSRVGDEGVAQLPAAPLTHLDLSNTQVTDAALAALAQLPLLSLDLSDTRVTGCRPPGVDALVLPSLTRLLLLQSRVDDRGCRHLAAVLPSLRSLALGAAGVGDKGVKALCALPQLEELRLAGCDSLSDAGLARALPSCPALRRLHLAKCWLVTPAGLAVAAALQRAGGGQLADVTLDDASIKLGGSRPWAAGPATGGSTAGPAAPAKARASGRRLTAEVLEHDERVAYSRQELLELRQEAAAAAAAARELRAQLPADLVSGP